MDRNQLNQQNIDHKGTQDDPNDPFQFSNLEKLAKIAKYNITTSDKEPIKTFLGIVLKAEWVPSLDDGFTEKDLVNINSPNGRGAYKCIVRIPEVHSCIPEPKQPALQDPNNKTGEPNFDDFYVLMHDDFYVDNVSEYEKKTMPQPGDIVVCDYKYRDVRLGGIITSIYPKAGAAGGVYKKYVSNTNGTAAAFDTSAAQGHSRTMSTKKLNPNYEGDLDLQKKLDIIQPRLRVLVGNIYSGLVAAGFDQKSIWITSTWRDSNKQAYLTSKKNPPNPTNFSYHIVITEPPDSDYYEPQAYAVDISYPMGKAGSKERERQEEFYKKLGELVEKENLTWGGTFKVKAYHSAYKHDRKRRTGLGWDPQHMSLRKMLNSTQQGEIKAETKRIYKKLGQTELK